MDLSYNHWGAGKLPLDRIKRETCITVKTLPYRTEPRFDSPISDGNYYDQLVDNTVVSEDASFPFGIMVYDTSFTVLPGVIITLNHCGIMMRGNYTLNMNGDGVNVVIESNVDSVFPLISYSGDQSVTLSNVDIIARKRPSVIEFLPTNGSTATLTLENILFDTVIYSTGNHVYMNTVAANHVIIRGCRFYGNNYININHQGSLLFERNKYLSTHSDEDVHTALRYVGQNLTISRSNFTSDFTIINAVAERILISGNRFSYDNDSPRITKDMIALNITAPDTYLETNLFLGMRQTLLLMIINAVTRCELVANHFERNDCLLSMINFHGVFTRIVGRNNTLRSNRARPVILVEDWSTDENPFLDWQYNTMYDYSVTEIASSIPTDARYNYWGSSDVWMVATRNSMSQYMINPYLNYPPGVDNTNVTDCVAVYGKRVNSNCEFGTCFTYQGYNVLACSGHGVCTVNSTCLCDSGYYGERCDEFSCFNVSHKAGNVCNFGTCLAPDVCKCKLLQNGRNCEFYSCDGIDEKNATVCSGNGKCIASNVCNCTQGYLGINCEMWTCAGIMRVRTEGCPDGCTFKGDYGCSQHGICTGYNKCNCSQGYYGDYCENYNCDGIRYDNSSVCSGVGKCIDPDKCNCPEGLHTGKNCEYPICYGKYGANACGNGYCGKSNTCICNKGYTGSECELPICSKY